MINGVLLYQHKYMKLVRMITISLHCILSSGWMNPFSYIYIKRILSRHTLFFSHIASHRIVLYCIVSFRAGHNLNLGHSNQIKEGEYEDLTGFMGLSFLEQQGAKQCFNPSKSYQL